MGERKRGRKEKGERLRERERERGRSSCGGEKRERKKTTISNGLFKSPNIKYYILGQVTLDNSLLNSDMYSNRLEICRRFRDYMTHTMCIKSPNITEKIFSV